MEKYESGIVAEKTRFTDAIFNLMIQINMNNGPDFLNIFTKYVEILECMLDPYIDKKYNKDIEESIRESQKKILAGAEDGKIDESRIETEKWYTVKRKYSALCNLLYRKEMLPQFKIKPKDVGVA